MVEVVLKDLEKRYDSVVAATDVNLTVKDREFVVLVGPSGCGKTTTLRMIAGLEDVSSGQIFIGGRDVTWLAPKDRDIAMVFQNYALYPHLSVRDNMAFCLEMRRFTRPDIDSRVEEASGVLGIGNLLPRKPSQLSGGQRQRVAVGRAIVRYPKVFLFDEPLSNLDAKLRAMMRGELKRLHYRLEATAIYVTHDQVEAMTLADRVVVMKDGRIQQVGAPLEIYSRPANKFVAEFIGSPGMNFLECRCLAEAGGLALKASDFGVVVPPALAAGMAPYKDKLVYVGMRPEKIRLASSGDRAEGPSFEGIVEVVEPLGADVLLDVRVGTSTVVVRIPPESAVRANERLRFTVEPSDLRLFDGATEAAISLV